MYEIVKMHEGERVKTDAKDVCVRERLCVTTFALLLQLKYVITTSPIRIQRQMNKINLYCSGELLKQQSNNEISCWGFVKVFYVLGCLFW